MTAIDQFEAQHAKFKAELDQLAKQRGIAPQTAEQEKKQRRHLFFSFSIPPYLNIDGGAWAFKMPRDCRFYRCMFTHAGWIIRRLDVDGGSAFRGPMLAPQIPTDVATPNAFDVEWPPVTFAAGSEILLVITRGDAPRLIRPTGWRFWLKRRWHLWREGVDLLAPHEIAGALVVEAFDE